jgi:uncharacterized membrane protein
MSHKNEDMCCTIRMIAALVGVMAAITITLHFTGDLMQAGIVGVVASIYAIGLLLASCAFVHEKIVSRQRS